MELDTPFGELDEDQQMAILINAAKNGLINSREIAEDVLTMIKKFSLDEQLFPLKRALEYVLSGDRKLIEILNPIYKEVTEDVVECLLKAGCTLPDILLPTKNQNPRIPVRK